MRAVEFTIELNTKPVVTMPREIAAQLPDSGTARVIILAADDPEDAEWRAAAYEQFARDDSPEDAVYDGPTCYDLAKQAGLIGTAEGLPPDLSTNRSHLEGFGTR